MKFSIIILLLLTCFSLYCEVLEVVHTITEVDGKFLNPRQPTGTPFDLNHDGYNDLLFTSRDSLYVLYGGQTISDFSTSFVKEVSGIVGNYQWAEISNYSWNSDFNGDGDNDITLDYDIGGEGHFTGYFGLEQTFGNALPIDFSPYVEGLGDYERTTAKVTSSRYDFNGDGYHDIIAEDSWIKYYADGDNEVTIFFGSPAGDFLNTFTIIAPNYSTKQIKSCDFNGDGFTDMLYSPLDSFIIYPGGENLSSIPIEKTNDFRFSFNSHGDFNGDGYVDLARVRSTHSNGLADVSIEIAYCDSLFNFHFGEYSFQRPLASHWDNNGMRLAVANLNSDNFDDIVVYNNNDNFLTTLVCGPDSIEAQYDTIIGENGYRKIWGCGNIVGDTQNELILYSYDHHTQTVFHIIQSSIPPIANDDNENRVPTIDVSLSSYPNPFNPRTTISFSLPESALVELAIFDIRGRRVIKKNSEYLREGKHTWIWDANENASGIYFVRLNAGRETVVKKVVLLK